MDMGQYNHESGSLYCSEIEQDEEIWLKDTEEFEDARAKYIVQIEDISKMLKHQRNMKKIKKECFKNMIAGPSMIEAQALKVNKQSQSQKDSIISGPAKAAHKNSFNMGAYNSDPEDNKQSDSQTNVKEEVNREAKHWHQQFHRQSSHDDLNDL